MSGLDGTSDLGDSIPRGNSRRDQSRIREVCRRFQSDFSRSKERPRIADFLAEVSDAQQQELLASLLSAEVKLRIARGDHPTIEDYQSEPWFRSSASVLQQILNQSNPVPGQASNSDETMPGKVASHTDPYATLASQPTSPLKPDSVPPPPSQGRPIGNYVMLRRLGSGGMGDVFLASHQRFSQRRYALKLIRPGYASPDAVARFEREIATMGQLSHPNLVFATDAGLHHGQLYLVMEFVDGKDLHEIIRRAGRLPVSEACEIVRQVALGVAAAHKIGIVHRDIKPGNIMISRGGAVKLLDLGMATLETEDHGLTEAGSALGTAAFMAPEQWHDARSVGKAADVYALGCTLYCLLTGKPPFNWEEQNRITDLMQRHLHAEPLPASDRNTEVPTSLSEILTNVLAKDPAQRLPDAASVAEALEPFANQAVPSAALKAIEPVTHVSQLPPSIIPDTAHDNDNLRWSRNVDKPAASLTRITVIASALILISVASLVMAYFGSSTTEAWTQQFDRLDGRAVPPGTGFGIELVRALMFISLTCYLVGTRFTASIRKMFNIRVWTPKLVAGRLITLLLVGFFVHAESERHLSLDGAPRDMVTWAEENGIQTTPAQEAVSYQWYLPYSLVNYIVVLGGLFAFPLIQFWASDFSYMLRQRERFERAQRETNSGGAAVSNLHRFAHECRALTTRYIDVLGILCVGIHFEYWIGQLTLSDAGVQTAVLGWFVVGCAIAFVLAISAIYGRGYEVSSQAIAAQGALDQEHALARLNLVWFLKTTVVSQLGGVMLLSLVAVGLHAALR